jgi:hypothetical protein
VVVTQSSDMIESNTQMLNLCDKCATMCKLSLLIPVESLYYVGGNTSEKVLTCRILGLAEVKDAILIC